MASFKRQLAPVWYHYMKYCGITDFTEKYQFFQSNAVLFSVSLWKMKDFHKIGCFQGNEQILRFFKRQIASMQTSFKDAILFDVLI